MTETVTGAETITIATGEDLLVATDADLPMTTVVGTMIVVAVTITDLLEEDLAVARLLATIITINMDLRVQEVVIHMAHPAEEVARRQTIAAEVAAIAAGMKIFQEFRSWFATLVHTSPTTTLARLSDASVTSVMCTFRGITTRSKRRVLPLLNMQILIVSLDMGMAVSNSPPRFQQFTDIFYFLSWIFLL